MNSLELNNLDLVELDAKESKQIEGGNEFVLFRFTLTGLFDKVKHNTECHLTILGINIF